MEDSTEAFCPVSRLLNRPTRGEQYEKTKLDRVELETLRGRTKPAWCRRYSRELWMKKKKKFVYLYCDVWKALDREGREKNLKKRFPDRREDKLLVLHVWVSSSSSLNNPLRFSDPSHEKPLHTCMRMHTDTHIQSSIFALF